jgi:hypothetical protein
VRSLRNRPLTKKALISRDFSGPETWPEWLEAAELTAIASIVLPPNKKTRGKSRDMLSLTRFLKMTERPSAQSGPQPAA